MLAVHINVWLELHSPVEKEADLDLCSSLCLEYHAYQIEVNRKNATMCRERLDPITRV